MPAFLPKEIFLSHAGKDHKFVSALIECLNSHGLSVWSSPAHIRGAKQWHDEIGRSLRRCDWFIVVLSKASVRRPWVHRELLFALQQKRYINRIIPVLLEQCDVVKLSWTLPAIEMIDFRKSRQNASAKLLRIWNIRYDPKYYRWR